MCSNSPKICPQKEPLIYRTFWLCLQQKADKVKTTGLVARSKVIVYKSLYELVSWNRIWDLGRFWAGFGLSGQFRLDEFLVKFIYSKKAIQFCEISTVDLTVTTYQRWWFPKFFVSFSLNLKFTFTNYFQ